MDTKERILKEIEYIRGQYLADNPKEVQIVWSEGFNTGLDQVKDLIERLNF